MLAVEPALVCVMESCPQQIHMLRSSAPVSQNMTFLEVGSLEYELKMRTFSSSWAPNLTGVLVEKGNLNRHATGRLELCDHKPRTHRKRGGLEAILPRDVRVSLALPALISAIWPLAPGGNPPALF